MTVFEASLLPDAEKRQLCEELLSEFGVASWRATEKGELIHSCPIPGGHANGDRNPSASLNYKKLTFRCLGCGARGGFIWFMAVCRGEDAEGVRTWLENATGTGGREMDLGRLLEILEAYAAPAAPPPPIPRFNDATLDPWLAFEPHPYLTEPVSVGGRECRVETLEHFRVGYAPEYPMGPGRPTQERIVIPLFWRGGLVGWQARRLDDDDKPKYKFSPDFPRDRALFNYHHERTAVVVESPLSVLRHHHHVPTMLATYGKVVTEAQRRLLCRYDSLVLWPDPEPAAWDAAEELAEFMQDYGPVRIVDHPWDADPADLNDGTVDAIIADAVPYSVWERPTEFLTLTPA